MMATCDNDDIELGNCSKKPNQLPKINDKLGALVRPHSCNGLDGKFYLESSYGSHGT